MFVQNALENRTKKFPGRGHSSFLHNYRQSLVRFSLEKAAAKIHQRSSSNFRRSFVKEVGKSGTFASKSFFFKIHELFTEAAIGSRLMPLTSKKTAATSNKASQKSGVKRECMLVEEHTYIPPFGGWCQVCMFPSWVPYGVS